LFLEYNNTKANASVGVTGDFNEVIALAEHFTRSGNGLTFGVRQ
jgi:hypothetical protein